MEECKWNIKILGCYIRLTKKNRFIVLIQKQGQWIELLKI